MTFSGATQDLVRMMSNKADCCEAAAKLSVGTSGKDGGDRQMCVPEFWYRKEEPKADGRQACLDMVQNRLGMRKE